MAEPEKVQLTLNFDAGLVESYASCREFVAARVHHQGRPQKSIAADMDYSPSDLSRKLAEHPDDSRKFSLNDLEKFIEVTGDTSPVLYLVEKFLMSTGDEIAQLEEKLARLKQAQRFKEVV